MQCIAQGCYRVPKQGLWNCFCREGGWRALYAGAGPRSLKAGPSVGIIVSFYEIMKCVFSKRLHHEH